METEVLLLLFFKGLYCSLERRFNRFDNLYSHKVQTEIDFLQIPC